MLIHIKCLQCLYFQPRIIYRSTQNLYLYLKLTFLLPKHIFVHFSFIYIFSSICQFWWPYIDCINCNQNNRFVFRRLLYFGPYCPLAEKDVTVAHHQKYKITLSRSLLTKLPYIDCAFQLVHKILDCMAEVKRIPDSGFRGISKL